jgi:hypothetical protein
MDLSKSSPSVKNSSFGLLDLGQLDNSSKQLVKIIELLN